VEVKYETKILSPKATKF